MSGIVQWCAFVDVINRAESIDRDHRGSRGYVELRQSDLARMYKEGICGEELVKSIERKPRAAVDIVARDAEGKMALIEIKLCLETGASIGSLGKKIKYTLQALLRQYQSLDAIKLYVVVPRGFCNEVVKILWNRWERQIRDEIGKEYKHRRLNLEVRPTVYSSIYKVVIRDEERDRLLELREFPLTIKIDDRVIRISEIYIVEVAVR